MPCILCRPFAWFCKTFCGDCTTRQKAAQNKFHLWRWAQANESDLVAREPEHESVYAAALLQRSDPAAALQKLTELAERGSVRGMVRLGWAYQNGHGVAADDAQAEHWYLRAVDAGSQRALLYLGSFYRKRGDFARCEELYGIGAAHHWAPAMYYLAWIKLRHLPTRARREEARDLLTEAASLGDAGAELDLAVLSMRGRFGLRRIPSGCRMIGPAVDKMIAVAGEPLPTAAKQQDDPVYGVAPTIA